MAKIYVNTYLKYRNGRAGGEWLDAEDYIDYDGFRVACKELHVDEEDPEIMFSDYEDFPDDFYSESEIDPRLWNWLELDDNDREIVEAWLSDNCLNDENLQDIIDRFSGSYDSWSDYARETMEGCYQIPPYLEGYIDYNKMGRDMMLSSSGYTEYKGMIWLFEG